MQRALYNDTNERNVQQSVLNTQSLENHKLQTTLRYKNKFSLRIADICGISVRAL